MLVKDKVMSFGPSVAERERESFCVSLSVIFIHSTKMSSSCLLSVPHFYQLFLLFVSSNISGSNHIRQKESLLY